MSQELRKSFRIGDRVKVSLAGGWRKDFFGEIICGPESVQTLQGEDYFYWVDFDAPQHDLSEDGPYVKAQILSRYLEKVAET